MVDRHNGLMGGLMVIRQFDVESDGEFDLRNTMQEEIKLRWDRQQRSCATTVI